MEPATAVVSLVSPEAMHSIRSSFCNQVHYFASPDEAAPWLERHPEATTIPVAAAFELATALVESMHLDPATVSPDRSGLNGAVCC